MTDPSETPKRWSAEEMRAEAEILRNGASAVETVVRTMGKPIPDVTAEKWRREAAMLAQAADTEEANARAFTCDVEQWPDADNAALQAEREAHQQTREELEQAREWRAAKEGGPDAGWTPGPPVVPEQFHQRLWDLVRYARGFLSNEGLLTAYEYAHLCSGRDSSKAARRLEDYDAVRADKDKADSALAAERERARPYRAWLEAEARRWTDAVLAQDRSRGTGVLYRLTGRRDQSCEALAEFDRRWPEQA